MKKCLVILVCWLSWICTTAQTVHQAVHIRETDRAFWLREMDRLARPVLESLAQDSLRINMPQVTSVNVDNRDHRIQVQYLEVLGRVLSGIAPWLQLEGGDAEEVQLRMQYRKWTIQGLENALDSAANDFMRFDIGGQQLVDASFLAIAVVRAPWIWENLPVKYQKQLVESIKTTRRFRPVYSNWLLFCAMNEVFLAKYGLDWDVVRVDYGLRQLEQWYVGDGMYQDGVHYAFDYYNSFVIHPYLAAIVDVLENKTEAYKDMFGKIKKRNLRYAAILERLINTDGTYPPSGRSVIYRGATFHHLADMAWKGRLPQELKPKQVRGALTAVLRKTMEAPTTYEKGWLTIGLYGAQPSLGDFYNNQGSPYICANLFLPLGLPATDDFWTGDSLPWTAQQIWSGAAAVKDYGVDLR
ncbi:DUF2264 domain-containing protein [Sphingobacterium psychroaquaticum]|uniref:DUF2264 domain-containing protein n=1 Tax=Sphingobacterium psychroaquaticum TaxID=561061 RepID=A0A1X7JM12_9SPHI|nr:DUF2264 domain-containing protein [Sphingobacterium psychroaquaticum]SMG28995.1 hypothetical protein SAMN05660862_1862 [Sphingobacterium psychroaquaticum]